MNQTLGTNRQSRESEPQVEAANRSAASIQIGRPFDVVARQLLDLGEAWFEDAVRRAGLSAACGGSGPVWVRLSWPSREPGALRLPMEWEVAHDPSPWTVSGELRLRPLGATETRIDLALDAPGTAEEGFDDAAQSFLRALFWTLEALNRYDRRAPEAGP